LEAFERFNTVSTKVFYEPADKAEMLADRETSVSCSAARQGICG
jgi:hypothetical protein